MTLTTLAWVPLLYVGIAAGIELFKEPSARLGLDPGVFESRQLQIQLRILLVRFPHAGIIGTRPSDHADGLIEDRSKPASCPEIARLRRQG